MTTQAQLGLSQDQLVAEVDAGLRDFVDGRGLPRNLADAVLYAALGPGKRVRPTLVVRCYEAISGPVSTPMPAALRIAASAVEMVHAFSLVHDDLPAMDDDDLRRGRPTLHKHTTEAMAILAGDGLLALSFEMIATQIADPTLVGQLVGELAMATNDMIAGQVHDTLPPPELIKSGGALAMDWLVNTHRLKTGALLRAAARMGGACAEATAEQLEALTRYADAVGLMFQVVDDLLDVTSDAQALGKATQKDAAAGKLTYPGLMGLDGAQAEVQRLRGEALSAIEPMGDSAVSLRQLAEDLAVRRK